MLENTLTKKKGKISIGLIGGLGAISIWKDRKWPDLSNASQKDYEALKGDWENVGKDLQRAIDCYEEEGRRQW